MNTNNRTIRINSQCLTYAVVVLFSLVGCQSKHQYPSDLQKRQAEMRLEQPEAGFGGAGRSSILSARSYFEMMDDEASQWQANYKLASESMLSSNTEDALRFAHQAYDLAEKLQDRRYLFQSAIQMGQLSGQQTYYEQAAEYAETDIEKAIALTCLQNYPQAKLLFEHYDGRENPEVFAFLYYYYGKNSDDVSAVMVALGLYRQVGNAYGVVDSLYLAARMSESSELVRDYGMRALLAARHLPDQKRRLAIESWLAKLPE